MLVSLKINETVIIELSGLVANTLSMYLYSILNLHTHSIDRINQKTIEMNVRESTKQKQHKFKN